MCVCVFVCVHVYVCVCACVCVCVHICMRVYLHGAEFTIYIDGTHYRVWSNAITAVGIRRNGDNSFS